MRYREGGSLDTSAVQELQSGATADESEAVRVAMAFALQKLGQNYVTRIVDAEGRSYLDYIGSWGPMIVGHNLLDPIAAQSFGFANIAAFGVGTASPLSRGGIRRCRAALDLGTSQACAMKIPACISGNGNPSLLGIKRTRGR